MEKKIEIKFNNAALDSLFFSYLDNAEKSDVRERIKLESSVVCEFIVNGNVVFCVIYDFDYAEKFLHIREVGGMFDRKEFSIVSGFKLLNHFSEGLAKFCGLKALSFDGDRAFYKKAHGSFGFTPIAENVYERRLH